MRILLVEDEKNMRALIREYLFQEGYEVVEAKDGEEACDKLWSLEYDGVILDIMLPKKDGWSVLKEIRTLEVPIPVIMLTAKGEEYDKLLGFELGADDYITKPFSPKELMARLKAILRRYNNNQNIDEIIIGNLKVDTSSRNVYVGSKVCKLTPKEFDLLIYLIKNKGKALRRQQILDGVWGYDFFGSDRTVDTHIKMLRESLGAESKLIMTVWGIGYKLEESGDEL